MLINALPRHRAERRARRHDGRTRRAARRLAGSLLFWLVLLSLASRALYFLVDPYSAQAAAALCWLEDLWVLSVVLRTAVRGG